MKPQIIPTALLLAITTTTVSAQTGTPMTGDEYNAYVAGRTFVINIPGEPPYGIEAYLSNRQVTWGFLETNVCLDGVWFEPVPRVICYSYDDGEDRLHCWQYFKSDGQFYAQLTDELGNPNGEPPYEVFETTASLPCVQDFLGS